jgi:hypothetical protein
MITKIEWKNGLWIATLDINGGREEAVSRRDFDDMIRVARRLIAQSKGAMAA